MINAKRNKALEMLMPLGGYTDDGKTVTLIDDFGYTAPTDGEIEAAEVVAEKYIRLEELDSIITRDKEVLALLEGRALSVREQEAIDEKVAIRASLVV